MSVTREDGGNIARRRPVRKPPEPMTGAVAAPAALPPATSNDGPRALRLDDLYRLPMPKLFALAEREGIGEHTGMTRGQLIVGIVRQRRRAQLVRVRLHDLGDQRSEPQAMSDKRGGEGIEERGV